MVSIHVCYLHAYQTTLSCLGIIESPPRYPIFAFWIELIFDTLTFVTLNSGTLGINSSHVLLVLLSKVAPVLITNLFARDLYLCLQYISSSNLYSSFYMTWIFDISFSSSIFIYY